jgi:hypothetical protein
VLSRAIQRYRVSGCESVSTVCHGWGNAFRDRCMNVWQEVSVVLRLRDRGGQNMLWEKEILGVEVDALWVGATAEHEK